MPEVTGNSADPPSRDVLLALRDQFDAHALEPPSQPTMDDVRRFVTERIGVLLAGRREMLFSILYRIDVSEEAVLNVLRNAPPGEVPELLADLVIERQLQKLRIRRHYASRGTGETDRQRPAEG